MKPLVYLVPLFLLAACGSGNSPVIISGSCSIDQPATNATLPVTQNFNVSGWAFDLQSGILPEHFRIQFTSNDRKISKVFDVKHDIKRADVAKALNAPTAEASGFSLDVPANSLVPGNYDVVILQDLPDTLLACGTGHIQLVK